MGFTIRTNDKSETREKGAARIIARCRELAGCTETPGETTRTFLSAPMHDVHRHVTEWMTEAGMTVQVDAIGNIRGLLGHTTAPRLIVASHLDTVPNAGAFDGILGVIFGIELAASLPERDLPLAIEIIGFSEEEGVRFRRPFLGSMALAGTLDDEHLALKDTSGITVAGAIQEFGLNPVDINEARNSPQTVAYLECHIEQGPVLESLDRPLGIVTALVGQTRMEFNFTGQSNHAGTTPMSLRHDALTAASAWVVAIEALAQQTNGLVATVGRIEAFPGAGNVVPGKVTALLDIRHANDTVRAQSLTHLQEAARSAAQTRGVTVSHRLLLEQSAVALDPHLTTMLEEAARKAGADPILLTSGAGHDAMIVAPHIPSAMLFVRSPGGISHHPDETVLEADIEAALATGVEFIASLTNSNK